MELRKKMVVFNWEKKMVTTTVMVVTMHAA